MRITGTRQVAAGRLHPYGVTSAQRSPAAPNIPTAKWAKVINAAGIKAGS